jgi:dimethylhistidine N-methyltransferase
MIAPHTDGLTQVGDRFLLYTPPQPQRTASFADDVRAGLWAPRKHLSSKYFYDDLGSALFEAICYLPEYYLTRAETEILETHAGEIFDAIGEPVELVEFGSGSARKTRLLIEEALRRQVRVDYHPVDISPSALTASSFDLIAAYERLYVTAYASDYIRVLEEARLRTNMRVLALFLGSNIGNYGPDEAVALLRAMSGAFKQGDALLIGADLRKDRATLELAYDDPTGVTAAFNLNLLGRINRELGGTFEVRQFRHVARYDEARGSVDSFLASQRPQRVRIEALDGEVAFEASEAIHTETSYKFSHDEIETLARNAGYDLKNTWYDGARRFSLNLFVVR